MKDNLIKALTDGDFHTAGSLIGLELPKKRLWLLSAIKAELEKMGMRDTLTVIANDPPSYSKGYTDAMNDIIESFEQVVREEVMNMIDDPSNPTDDDDFSDEGA